MTDEETVEMLFDAIAGVIQSRCYLPGSTKGMKRLERNVRKDLDDIRGLLCKLNAEEER